MHPLPNHIGVVLCSPPIYQVKEKGQRRAHIGCLSSSLPIPSLSLSLCLDGGIPWKDSDGDEHREGAQQALHTKIEDFGALLIVLASHLCHHSRDQEGHDSSKSWRRSSIFFWGVVLEEVAAICSSCCLSLVTTPCCHIVSSSH